MTHDDSLRTIVPRVRLDQLTGLFRQGCLSAHQVSLLAGFALAEIDNLRIELSDWRSAPHPCASCSLLKSSAVERLRTALEALVSGLCRGADTSRGEPTYWFCDGDGRVLRARAALTVEVP